MLTYYDTTSVGMPLRDFCSFMSFSDKKDMEAISLGNRTYVFATNLIQPEEAFRRLTSRPLGSKTNNLKIK